MLLHVLLIVLIVEAGGQQAFARSWSSTPSRQRGRLCVFRARRRGIAPRGVLGRLLSNKIVKDVEREEAEDLRREALENAGQAAIDKLDGPMTQGATRLVSEMLNRIDDNVIAAASKGTSFIEKGLPSAQGFAAKIQGTEFSSILVSGGGKHADFASGLVANLANVLSQEQFNQLLVDTPLQFAQFAAPFIAGGGWEFVFSTLR